jgi:diguanylate cyclase (GGDEF)-like protein/PAS domain S-box-containing protein
MEIKPDKPFKNNNLRRKAEEKLKLKRQSHPHSDFSEINSQRLMHELEVHQIELEMQNEELHRIQEELEASQLRYFDLFDLAPVGYLVLDEKKIVTDANFTVSTLLGVDRSGLIKQPITRFILSEDQDIFYQHCQELIEEKTPQQCELRIKPANKASVWVRLEATITQKFNRDAVYRIMVSDISERRQAEEALKYLSSHDKLTGLYNRAFFEEEMARLERGREFPVSIVIADVDHLKITNDKDGHAAGDALLMRAAQAMTTAFRTEDVIARIGGDEFAVLLPNTSAAATEIALNRVRHAIEQDNSLHVRPLLRLSLGASTAELKDSFIEVLKLADENMYHDKKKNNTTK